ncbi:ATP-binding protein [Paenibacillus aceris]|uniref:histidine kinase n=1 Tax=Paenibacillus aceris TaxID=869555 RepID=A0ABS4HYC0_9BACL|nr:ATP-binding protein [Paenibacillus aceris]MBP1962934.1 PAS domain S-box-containing protein [Paenibacillus aceris]NHW38360.1 PAS domain S-box protein [Paenibacillus aceris]
MILYDYVVNLSIFSLLVSTPLVIRSFINHKPLKQLHLWAGVYAGLVSVILIMLSVKQQGYSYDIRYAPVILVFAYLGPVPGLITGLFSLMTRLLSSGNWFPAIVGWTFIMGVFSVLHLYISRFTPLKKTAALMGTYIVLYIITVLSFHILVNQPLFHLQYLLFVVLGVILGGLLIESNERLRRIITEKKLMEKTLEASESKYRLIAENTSDLIMVMDKDHSVSYFSPSHELVLGYKGFELEGIELCKLVHPDDVANFKCSIMKMFEDKESHSMETRFKHKDGCWIELESRCRSVRGEEGTIKHIVIISRDISERKKAEEILLQSEKLSVVGELAAGVAHEIRNPLTTIKGFLQIYKRENHSIKFSDLLLSELERIETITSELLSLAKPQAVQLVCTDVEELIEYTLEFLSPQSLLNNIEFKRNYEESKLPITCEKNQLKQVFLNILKNAIESMPNGGEIDIRLGKVGEDVCMISIKDQGCGIPEELLPRLGQPFYSLKEKGTGLGLMICHRIIKQHRGSITYKSRVNEGTLIEIRLPMTKRE